jgi:flagellar motor switch protein FliG
MSLPPAIRKAAVLLSSLDDSTADALLEQMSPEQIFHVRQAIELLGPIEQDEREQVINEFFHRGTAASRPAASSPRPAMPAAKPIRAPSRPIEVEDELALSDVPPFQFLEETESAELVPFLADEHPQTIAVVISHMPAARATAVLANLPPALQAEIVGRLVELDEMHPTILREVERGLESRIGAQARRGRRRAAGVAAVSRIFAAADRGVVRAILSNVAAHDHALANEFVQPAPSSAPARTMRYEELTALDDGTLLTIFTQAGPDLAVLALAGSEVELIERIMARLPTKQARSLRHDLDHLGPTRLSDVEQAQQELVRIAQEMASQDELVLSQN